MASDWSIRPCQNEDAPVMREVWRAGLAQTYETFTGEKRQHWEAIFDKEAVHAMGPTGDLSDPVAYWVREGRGTAFVAENRAGTVGGMVAVKEGQSIEWSSSDDTAGFGSSGSDGTVSVWRLSVTAHARRQGLGSRLMQVVEEWALAHGYRRVQMMTANAAASLFYESIGYAIFRADGPVNFHCKLLQADGARQQPQGQEQQQLQAEEQQPQGQEQQQPQAEEQQQQERGQGQQPHMQAEEQQQLQQPSGAALATTETPATRHACVPRDCNKQRGSPPNAPLCPSLHSLP